MERIFEKAKDKNVAAVVLYINDGALYYDAAFEDAVAYKEDAVDLFLNGAVVLDDGVYYTPISVSVDGELAYGEVETSELPARPEPELPEDAHTIPPNKWNGDLEEETEEEPSEPAEPEEPAEPGE